MIKNYLLTALVLTSSIGLNSRASASQTVEFEDIVPPGPDAYIYLDAGELLRNDILKSTIYGLAEQAGVVKANFFGTNLDQLMNICSDLTAEMVMYFSKADGSQVNKSGIKLEVVSLINSKKLNLLIDLLTSYKGNNVNQEYESRGFKGLVFKEEHTWLVRLNASQLLVIGGTGFDITDGKFIHSILDRCFDEQKGNEDRLKNSGVINEIRSVKDQYSLGLLVDVELILGKVLGKDSLISQSDPMYMIVMMGKSLYDSVKSAIGDIKSVEVGIKRQAGNNIMVGYGINIGENLGISDAWSGKMESIEYTDLDIPESCVSFGATVVSFSKIFDRILPVIKEVEQYGFLPFLKGVDVEDVLSRIAPNIGRLHLAYNLNRNGLENVWKVSSRQSVELVELIDQTLKQMQFPVNYARYTFDGINSLKIEFPNSNGDVGKASEFVLVPDGDFIYAGNPDAIRLVRNGSNDEELAARYRKLMDYLPADIASFSLSLEESFAAAYGSSGELKVAWEKFKKRARLSSVIEGINERYDISIVIYSSLKQNKFNCNFLIVFQQGEAK